MVVGPRSAGPGAEPWGLRAPGIGGLLVRGPGPVLEHLGDEALAAALAPIDRWADELPAPDWQRIAKLANASLDCSAWGPPPWPADRWATLQVVLELAQEAAANG